MPSLLQSILCKLGLHDWGPTRTVRPSNYVDSDGRWQFNPGGSFRFCKSCHTSETVKGIRDAGKQA